MVRLLLLKYKLEAVLVMQLWLQHSMLKQQQLIGADLLNLSAQTNQIQELMMLEVKTATFGFREKHKELG
jgi:hypothetical protein